MEECITFGREAGLMSPEESAEVDKVLAAVKQGAKPPPCRGRQACDRYCSEPNHMEECITFAQAAGFMSPQEAEDAGKMLAAMKKGVKPPACRGKEECDRYCGDEAHADECIAFAEAAGFMKPEEAAMARRTGGKGPGGCRGKEECEAFCNNPANQETCFNFGREHGLIPPEELQKMEEGKQQFSQVIHQAPPAVADCIVGAVGAEQFEKFKSGAAIPPPSIGEAMRTCFERGMGPGTPGAPGVPGMPGGPGMPGAGGAMMPPGQAGPGGCATPEECQSFCMSNPEACRDFAPPGEFPGRMPPEGEFPRGMMPPCEGEDCAQPGMPGQYPQGFMPPEGSPLPGGFQPPEGFMPRQGMMPQEGQMMQPGGTGMPGQYQYPQPGMMPPEGFQPMQGMMPPQDFQQPPQGFTPPPTSGGEASPPPPPPPSGMNPFQQFFASIAAAFFGIGR